MQALSHLSNPSDMTMQLKHLMWLSVTGERKLLLSEERIANLHVGSIFSRQWQSSSLLTWKKIQADESLA